MTAAIGTVTGLGEYALAVASCFMAVSVLAILRPVTKAISKVTSLDESDV